MRSAKLLVLLLAAPLSAQPVPGDCALGTATGVLDANRVKAKVYLTGSLFFGADDEAAYVVPTELGRSPIFAAGLWVGGKVEGELRMAGSRYTDFEFWPGPLGDDARPVDPSDCSAYDRIWVVSREDVRDYLQTGEATDDLWEWPADLGAPVLDGDGVAGNYNLEGGDQPAIRGEQTAWWVMNDVGNEHLETQTLPLGVEVRVEAFAEAEPTTPPTFQTLGTATFYRYLITNRTDAVIDSAYVAFFVDFDLGDAGDDYVGTDTLGNLLYVYNSDNIDGGSNGYGEAPPAVGAVVLQAPIGLPNGRDDDFDGDVDEPGEELGLATSRYFNGGPPGTSDPSIGPEYYLTMQGVWTNGQPMVTCGIGINCNGDVTTFSYPGDPITGSGWSEVSANNSAGDRRGVASVGPFRLDPGETEEVAFGISYGRGATNLQSINVLRGAAAESRFLYRNGGLDPARVTLAGGGPGSEDEQPSALRLSRPAPNPFTDGLALRYEVPAATPLHLAVYDALGREVATLFDGTAEPGVYDTALDGADLAPGVYFVRLAVPGGSRTLAVTRGPR